MQVTTKNFMPSLLYPPSPMQPKIQAHRVLLFSLLCLWMFINIPRKQIIILGRRCRYR